MANSGAVVLNSVWHLICSTEGPFKAYCGADLYTSGRPSLFVGPQYGEANCEICSIKDKENDEAALAAHAVMVKGLSPCSRDSGRNARIPIWFAEVVPLGAI